MIILAIRGIRTAEDPVLRRQAQPVTDFSSATAAILDDLAETMEHYNGVGLAAPQIGLSLAMVVVRPSQELPVFEFINPVITSCSGQAIDVEGCLSVPGAFGQVSRCTDIELEFQDRRGQRKSIRVSGMFARIAQHEIDHLAGILFVDKALSMIPEEDDES